MEAYFPKYLEFVFLNVQRHSSEIHRFPLRFRKFSRKAHIVFAIPSIFKELCGFHRKPTIYKEIHYKLIEID